MNLRSIIAWAAAGMGAVAFIVGAILAISELSARKTEATQLQDDIGRLRSRAEEAEKLIETLRAELAAKETALAAEIQALGERNQALASERDSLSGERDAAAREIEDLKGKLAAKTGEFDKLLGSLDAISGSIAELRSGLEEMKGLKNSNDLLAAEVDRLGAELRQAAGKLAEAESLAGKLREERGRLEVEVQRMGQEIALLRRSAREAEGPGPEEPPSPARGAGARPAGPLEATVDAVDNEKGIVVLGIGAGNGVREEMVFTIRRGRDLIATVKVSKVYPEFAGCAVLRREPGQQVRIGDRALSESP